MNQHNDMPPLKFAFHFMLYAIFVDFLEHLDVGFRFAEVSAVLDGKVLIPQLVLGHDFFLLFVGLLDVAPAAVLVHGEPPIMVFYPMTENIVLEPIVAPLLVLLLVQVT